jgi:hypothetical protein
VGLAAVLLLLAAAASAAAFSGQPAKRDHSWTYCAQSEPEELNDLEELDDELRSVVDSWDSAAGKTVSSALVVAVWTRGANCSAEVRVRTEAPVWPDTCANTADWEGWLAKWEEEDNEFYITLNDCYSWSINGATGTYDVGHVLAEEVGHTFGLGHAGEGEYWDKNGEDPSMMGGTPPGTEAGETIETDDKGGALWARDGTIWSANAGFEKFLSSWTTYGEVTAGQVNPYSGDRRARLGTGSHIQTRFTYDPWDTNYPDPDDNVLYDGMSDRPIIYFTAWMRDNNLYSGSGEVRLLYKYRTFDYRGDKTKRSSDPEVFYLQSTYVELDSDPPLQTYTALSGQKVFDLPMYYDGDVIMHRAVQILMRIENQHNSRVLVDEAGLSGGV